MFLLQPRLTTVVLYVPRQQQLVQAFLGTLGSSKPLSIWHCPQQSIGHQTQNNTFRVWCFVSERSLPIYVAHNPRRSCLLHCSDIMVTSGAITSVIDFGPTMGKHWRVKDHCSLHDGFSLVLADFKSFANLVEHAMHTGRIIKKTSFF